MQRSLEVSIGHTPIVLCALPKNTTSELAAYLHTILLNAERQAGKLWIPTF